MELRGCYTAIVTPFVDGEVCFTTLRELVEKQIAAGIDGIVPVGTTGESPTLGMDEHRKVISTVIETAAGRCQVVAGTGANATDEAIELTRFAKEAGADATLQVTPYYNKPTDEGLFRHFSAVADIGLPVMLYNVPGRSAVALSIPLIERLSAHESIVAVKEAGGSVDRVSQIKSVCDLNVLSGDDMLTLPMIALGATGVVSVASNVAPARVRESVHLALDGCWEAARQTHYALYNLYNSMFIETNPVPVKAAMAILGDIREEYRLPLCAPSEETREQLRKSLTAAGLLDS
jgi:4-hydroxy-tetrahydrodipicolinate synthase